MTPQEMRAMREWAELMITSAREVVADPKLKAELLINFPTDVVEEFETIADLDPSALSDLQLWRVIQVGSPVYLGTLERFGLTE